MKEINHECYISPEVAKLLEEAGFNWESHFTCEQQQDEWQQSASIEVSNPHYDKSIPFSSPTNIVVLPHVTLEVAQKWLREVKDVDIVVNIDYHYGEHYSKAYYCSFYIGDKLYTTEHFKTYEDAQEAGIEKALEIILEKGE